jgi:hypothetical protein
MAGWEVITVDGPERECRALVAAFLADRAADPWAVVLGDDVGLREGGGHAVLALDVLAAELAEAFARGGPAVGLRAVARRPVARAAFETHADVAARDVAAGLRAALKGAPMSAHAESEEAHASSQGAGGLVQTYAYRVRATVDGSVADVLAVRHRLAAIDVAQIGPLRLT